MKIRIAGDLQSVSDAGGYRPYVERLVRQRWPGAGVTWAIQGTVHTYVNRSLWAVDCPFCAGAMPAQPDEPFFCPDCLMQGNGFKAMAVEWPDERAAIEALLVKRNDPNTRNWLVGETADDLARENAEHGVE